MDTISRTSTLEKRLAIGRSILFDGNHHCCSLGLIKFKCFQGQTISHCPDLYLLFWRNVGGGYLRIAFKVYSFRSYCATTNSNFFFSHKLGGISSFDIGLLQRELWNNEIRTYFDKHPEFLNIKNLLSALFLIKFSF